MLKIEFFPPKWEYTSSGCPKMYSLFMKSLYQKNRGPPTLYLIWAPVSFVKPSLPQRFSRPPQGVTSMKRRPGMSSPCGWVLAKMVYGSRYAIQDKRLSTFSFFTRRNIMLSGRIFCSRNIIL